MGSNPIADTYDFFTFKGFTKTIVTSRHHNVEVCAHVDGRESRCSNIVVTARLAQSVERQALNLMVVGSSPTVGAFLFLLQNEHI